MAVSNDIWLFQMGQCSILCTKLDSAARQSTGNYDIRAGQGLDLGSIESVKFVVREVAGENVILEVDKALKCVKNRPRDPKYDRQKRSSTELESRKMSNVK